MSVMSVNNLKKNDKNLPYLYEATAYPKIYKHTYWGSLRQYDKFEDHRAVVIPNRNNFITTYNVKKHYECRNYNVWCKFDIIDDINNDISGVYKKDLYRYAIGKDKEEFYKTNDGKTICIFSDDIEGQTKELAEKYGYREIPPMYSIGRKTYMKII